MDCFSTPAHAGTDINPRRSLALVLPSAPVRTGWTLCITQVFGTFTFSPCSHRVDQQVNKTIQAHDLHPLCIQGRRVPRLLSVALAPSSPVHTGQTWWVSACVFVVTFYPLWIYQYPGPVLPSTPATQGGPQPLN